MPETIWVTPADRGDGVYFWSVSDKDPRCTVRFDMCAPGLHDNVMIAVEDNPGFGYGEIASIELMTRPDEDGNLFLGDDGYAGFYRRVA